MMAKRFNKKSPCSCGSGKRYEQCCRRKVLAIRHAKEIFRQKDENREKFVEQFGHIRPPQLLDMPDGMFACVGSSLYKQTRPGDYTFLHVVHDHALLFFGEDYLKEQEQIPLHSRHPALQWMYKYVEQTETGEVTQTGAGAAWYRFAYDLYTIRDNANLETVLRERLLDIDHFQGARHELWTTALFIAANFEINFENEADNSRKHPEFVATDRESTAKIAVEAKSRHRRGVKGFAGGALKPPGAKVGVRSLVIDAYQKESCLPLYVVVDANLPPQTQDYGLEGWLQELDCMMNDLAAEGYADPCPANAIFFHNDPSHYLVDERIGSKFDELWITDYVPMNPRTPNEFTSVIRDRILKAHRQRLHPPENIPDM